MYVSISYNSLIFSAIRTCMYLFRTIRSFSLLFVHVCIFFVHFAHLLFVHACIFFVQFAHFLCCSLTFSAIGTCMYLFRTIRSFSLLFAHFFCYSYLYVSFS